MLSLSRMKSLLTPVLSRPTTMFVCRRYGILSTFKNVNSAQTMNPMSKVSSFRCSTVPNHNQIRVLNSEASGSSSGSGEVHVIVGPMFAGKTTTLLKRIKSERSNGSFQANGVKNSLYLDETIKGLCFSGRVAEAVGILCRSGVQVEAETYSLILQECIFRQAYKKGKRVHWQMITVGFVPNEYLTVKLLILYAKAGDLDTSHIIFDKLQFKSLVSWNAMIAGYVQKGMEEVGLSLYHDMKQRDVLPDQYTFSSVFRACASLAVLEQGKQAHALLIKSQISGNIVVNSALMDMYFKCSSPSDGYLVFSKSLERNVITWTALISGYGQNGRIKDVLESFHRMIDEGYRPNHVTFLAVLSACSHGGLVDRGKEYFSSMMRDYGLQPRGKHYAAIVDLLGRAGRLQEAHEFVKNSRCEEHPVLWGALLGACKIHGDMEMVKLAARNFFDLEPENAGKYVVLSNAYASFGLWNNVAEIRRLMKDSGVKKEPGYSMIEVQRQAHFFFMEHNAHEQTTEIYKLVKDMADKDTRYGLDSIVTHDGDRLPCWPLANLSSFKQRCGPEAYSKLEIIGIDEAQFFEDLYDFCKEVADHDGKIVIVAGLDGDYLRRSFGSVLDVIPIADSVTKLTARCELCGECASFTLRKTGETRTELIAGAEVYMPVCRKHYVSGQVVKEAARSVLESQKIECSSIL
ncbi:hypothetical protein H5410_054546 [Solanum commersonii]|uniref:thymidine kinase n=1 Tax=Solanum commersonii TaxID=4109 RepID=A0A9J5WGP8_SOLCO|nr:hypothetical protein H5410_054546 [Solanum commersonii]